MKTKILTVVILSAVAGSPALAGHGNPWATDISDLNMVFHDQNMAQSDGTPGEDEMRGDRVLRNAGAAIENNNRDNGRREMNGYAGGGTPSGGKANARAGRGASEGSKGAGKGAGKGKRQGRR